MKRAVTTAAYWWLLAACSLLPCPAVSRARPDAAAPADEDSHPLPHEEEGAQELNFTTNDDAYVGEEDQFVDDDDASYGEWVQEEDDPGSYGTPGQVIWASRGRYYVFARHFEYFIASEDGPAVSLTNATRVDVIDHAGVTDDWFAVEVAWRTAPVGSGGGGYNNNDARAEERRFYMSFELARAVDGGDSSNATSQSQSRWAVTSMRALDANGNWAYFYGTEDTLSAPLGECYTSGGSPSENLTITNDQGDLIRFTGLGIAAFLPWDDVAAYESCVEPSFTLFGEFFSGPWDVFQPPREDCVPLFIGKTVDITLNRRNTNCFIAPPASSSEEGGDGNSDATVYLVTIRVPLLGRYSITGEWRNDTAEGYAFNAPTIGLRYCTPANERILFEEYVSGVSVSLTAEEHATSRCESSTFDFLGNDSQSMWDPQDKVDVDQEVISNSSAVVWSTDRYFLKASAFGYIVQGEAPITITDTAKVQVDGDPGSDDYMSIEITWDDQDGLEKRFYAYLEANLTSWRVFEARVYDQTQEWVEFYDPGIEAPLETCFTAESLVVHNDRGSAFWFKNLVLAAFAPWEDKDSFEECVSTPISLLGVFPNGTLLDNRGDVDSIDGAVTTKEGVPATTSPACAATFSASAIIFLLSFAVFLP